MYAVVRSGSKQYRVRVGDIIEVEKLPVEPGQSVTLEDVLLVEQDGAVTVGTPTVPGARVVARVLDQVKGPKLIVFKMKPKTRYRRKTGHRQRYTRLQVEAIEAGAVS
ncbi:50S ribosomal protein L21 [Thermomicrobium sp. 4228-Ro]|uniref:50S ribosomal protein L21 n=1 Tax=Thermomicrobium sp. 4228-Ro TaxID=2993937 RepID=UPI002248AD0D|nr:50S ribosomal protein L21 [Thermomicrobium sp. 4228-Ro]MCX2726648.1 50S ribosomal protein L21 [Thermomicrobium sp. 4228-Ro]